MANPISTSPDDIALGAALTGCAGWSIPRDSAPAFSESGSHLERYASVFRAVEINSSFHRPHRQALYAKWAGCVPHDFQFSVKLPRTITHDAKLVGIDELLAQFAYEVQGLGGKLGCVLVQLPPKLELNEPVAADFFDRLGGALGCMIACEARNPSWFTGAATDLLTKRGVTRVIADPAKGQDVPHVATANTLYARLHGSPRIYYSSYSKAYLDQVAAVMAKHTAAGYDAWTIFDNTASSAAVANALSVEQAVKQRAES